MLCWKNNLNPKEKCVHLGCQTWPVVPLSFCHEGPGERPELTTGSDSGTSAHADSGSFLWWKYCCKLLWEAYSISQI